MTQTMKSATASEKEGISSSPDSIWCSGHADSVFHNENGSWFPFYVFVPESVETTLLSFLLLSTAGKMKWKVHIPEENHPELDNKDLDVNGRSWRIEGAG